MLNTINRCCVQSSDMFTLTRSRELENGLWGNENGIVTKKIWQEEWLIVSFKECLVKSVFSLNEIKYS